MRLAETEWTRRNETITSDTYMPFYFILNIRDEATSSSRPARIFALANSHFRHQHDLMSRLETPDCLEHKVRDAVQCMSNSCTEGGVFIETETIKAPQRLAHELAQVKHDRSDAWLQACSCYQPEPDILWSCVNIFGPGVVRFDI